MARASHFAALSELQWGKKQTQKYVAEKKKRKGKQRQKTHHLYRVIIAPTAPADSQADHFFHPTKHAELQTESSLKDPTPTEIDAEQCPPSTEPEF